MAWLKKQKIPQQGVDLEILTPDGEKILVGATENQVLLYQRGFNNWSSKNKQTGSWNLKAKTPV